MTRGPIACLLATSLLTFAPSCDTNNDIGPGTELPPQECNVAGKEPAGDPPQLAPICEVDLISGAEFPCSCPDFDGTFPPGTFDWELTRNPDACGENDEC